jgi:Leucine-rich repeat (LRR) protein
MKHYAPYKYFILLTACFCIFISSQLSAQETADTLVWNDSMFIATTAQLKSDTIPRYVFEIPGLQVLTIIGQDCEEERKPKDCWAINEIPAAIKNAKHLQRLSLSVNSISTIPPEIASLKELYFITLTDNAGLSDIANLAKVENLQELYLDGCSVETLPDQFAALKKLQVLSLVDNDIQPKEQARIKKLLPHCKIDFGTNESDDEK